MKRDSSRWVLAILFVVAGSTQSNAEIYSVAETMLGGDSKEVCCNDCGNGIPDCNCCAGGGLYADAEILFFKYMRADGVRAGSFSNVPAFGNDDVTFDYAASPRLTVGWVSNSGLGVRARYFEYDQAGAAVFPGTGVAMGVDTWNLDLEVFERICLNECWEFEVSAGIRYNEFEEFMIDPIPPAFRLNSFDGYGGILGLEGRRSLGRFGALYARGRGAIMQDDDKLVLNRGTVGPPGNAINPAIQDALLTDVTQGMTEIAIGWEYGRVMGNGALARFRVGYEWQNWYNYSTSFAPITSDAGVNPGSSFGGPADVGLTGFALSLGIER